MKLKFLVGALGAAATLIAQSAPGSAQSNTVVATQSGQIVKFVSDWNNNAMLVQLSSGVPFVNPGMCPATDYYETSPTDNGVALNHSILLSAYMAHASLSLIIQGCSFSGRPHIIGVSVPN